MSHSLASAVYMHALLLEAFIRMLLAHTCTSFR